MEGARRRARRPIAGARHRVQARSPNPAAEAVLWSKLTRRPELTNVNTAANRSASQSDVTPLLGRGSRRGQPLGRVGGLPVPSLAGVGQEPPPWSLLPERLTEVPEEEPAAGASRRKESRAGRSLVGPV